MRAEILEAIEDIPGTSIATRMTAFGGCARGNTDLTARYQTESISEHHRNPAVAFQHQLILSLDARCCKANRRENSMKAIALGVFGVPRCSHPPLSPRPSTRRRSVPSKSPTLIRSVWSATSIMDAAGGPEDRAMSCAITMTPATSPAGATTTTLAPATTIAVTAPADQGSSFAAGSQEAKGAAFWCGP